MSKLFLIGYQLLRNGSITVADQSKVTYCNDYYALPGGFTTKYKICVPKYTENY